MKVYLILYFFGYIGGIIGPLHPTNNLQANVLWCRNYIKEQLNPEWEATWQNPEKKKRLLNKYPTATTDSIRYRCRVLRNPRIYKTTRRLNERLEKKL